MRSSRRGFALERLEVALPGRRIELDLRHLQRLEVAAHRGQRRLELVRHVGQHLAALTIDRAQGLVAGREIRGHPVEGVRDARDLVAAAFRRAGREVAAAEPLGRGFQGLEAAARRLEDERGRDDRRDDEERRAGDRQQAADFADHRPSRQSRRQHRHAAQDPADLDRRHHHGRPLEPRLRVAGRAPAAHQAGGGAPQRLGQRLAAVGHDRPVPHDEIQRLQLRVLAGDELLEIDLRILRQRGADVGGDDGGNGVRRADRKRAAARDDVAEDRALRGEHRHDEDDEAEADPEIEASVPARAPRGEDPHRRYYRPSRRARRGVTVFSSGRHGFATPGGGFWGKWDS
jgi:hypothetical protein